VGGWNRLAINSKTLWGGWNRLAINSKTFWGGWNRLAINSKTLWGGWNELLLISTVWSAYRLRPMVIRIILWGDRNSLHKITWFCKSFWPQQHFLNLIEIRWPKLWRCIKDLGPGFNSRSHYKKGVEQQNRYTQCKQVYHKWYATELDWLSNSKSSS